MYTLEGVSSLKTSLLLMKSLNNTEAPTFWSALCFQRQSFYVCFKKKITISSVFELVGRIVEQSITLYNHCFDVT